MGSVEITVRIVKRLNTLNILSAIDKNYNFLKIKQRIKNPFLRGHVYCTSPKPVHDTKKLQTVVYIVKCTLHSKYLIFVPVAEIGNYVQHYVHDI